MERDLVADRKIAEAATQGEWEQVGNTVYFPHKEGVKLEERLDYFVLLGRISTVCYIATFQPSVVLDYIAEVEQLRQERDDWKLKKQIASAFYRELIEAVWCDGKPHENQDTIREIIALRNRAETMAAENKRIEHLYKGTSWPKTAGWTTEEEKPEEGESDLFCNQCSKPQWDDGTGLCSWRAGTEFGSCDGKQFRDVSEGKPEPQ